MISYSTLNRTLVGTIVVRNTPLEDIVKNLEKDHETVRRLIQDYVSLRLCLKTCLEGKADDCISFLSLLLRKLTGRNGHVNADYYDVFVYKITNVNNEHLYLMLIMCDYAMDSDPIMLRTDRELTEADRDTIENIAIEILRNSCGGRNLLYYTTRQVQELVRRIIGEDVEKLCQ